MVAIDLFTFYPIDFGEKQEDPELPHYIFVIEAMQACAKNEEDLWEAWVELSNSPLDFGEKD